MSGGPRRLAEGGRIDRAKPLRFRFNGRPYEGFEGDTLASALLGGGVTLTGRSFKYHRPRGIVGAGMEEPASLVELVGEASGSQPITAVRLREGLDARSVNCWPSPGFDALAALQLFAPLLPAGFYYKTFLWPSWGVFEPFIRRAAGLAEPPDREGEAGTFETRHAHCDVLVVGAGPAGLVAALAAGRAGARVLLVDDQPEPGGALLSTSETVGGMPGADWARDAAAELDALPNVRRLTQATAWGYREHNLVLVTERSPSLSSLSGRTWRVRARRVIVAAGAIERTLVFENNDRPQVMLASAARAWARRYGVAPGSRAVIFTNNDGAYAAARDLKAAGIEIAAIVDSRRAPDPALAIAVAPVLAGSVVARALGRSRVTGVEVRPLTGGATRRIDCDLVCMSGGWTPSVHLFSQARGRLRYDEALAAFVPGEAIEAVRCAGAADGALTLRAAIESGAKAGAEAATLVGCPASSPTLPMAGGDATYAIEPLWLVEPGRPSAKAFVDIQNDVTLADIRLALREGYDSVEHVKRYTTVGMGVDQGKTGNMNVIGAIAAASGAAPETIGTTTYRAPYTPVAFGAIAGPREGSTLLPYRRTPMTDWHEKRGAVMYESGARWRRPGYYPFPGERFEDCVARESRAVRERVGVYDGSPLGKIEIRGPNALDLVELVYTRALGSMRAGEGRYAIMMTDDGLILDDGVCFRLGDDHYLMSTSTAHADLVHRRIEELLQIERPDWKVAVTPVTSQWCNATICGPEARRVVEALGADIDLSNDAFPFMALRDANVADLPARICRVSFTGELSFEINVPGRHGLRLWEAVMEAGEPFGIEPVGSEANHVLRVEKGFLSLGHEVDATVDPYDLGMGWIVSRRKPDFLGKRAMEIRRAAGRPRRELVGLLPEDPERMVTEGAPLTPGGRRERSEGFVTACVRSVVQDCVVALALLSDGRARIGETAHIRLKDAVVPAKVVAPCFHDPEGLRLRS